MMNPIKRQHLSVTLKFQTAVSQSKTKALSTMRRQRMYLILAHLSHMALVKCEAVVLLFEVRGSQESTSG